MPDHKGMAALLSPAPEVLSLPAVPHHDHMTTLCCRCGDRAVVRVCSPLEDASLCAPCWAWLAAPEQGVHLEEDGVPLPVLLAP